MRDSEPSPPVEPSDRPGASRRRAPAWVRRPLRWCRNGLVGFGQFLLIAWSGLALHYSNLPWPWARTAMALAFVAFGVWALWLTRRKLTRRVFAGAFGALLLWWILIPASHDRPWRPEVATLPRVVIEGDRVRVLDSRHFVYRSADDFDVRHVEREFLLSRVVSVDLFVSYWKIGPVAHTFLSFNLDDGSPPMCISIETRPEIGEGFDPIASMFKQFELIYVVGDERDIVRVRTDYRDEEVFLYRIRSTPDTVQRLLRIYLDRINDLYAHPEWYHLLSNNCTLNIIRYSRAAGGVHGRFEIKHLLNGLIDRYVYGLGIVDTSLGFEELRRRSNITEKARSIGDAEDFSARIREGLPVPAAN